MFILNYKTKRKQLCYNTGNKTKHKKYTTAIVLYHEKKRGNIMDNLLTHYCPFCKNELVYREFYGVWGLYCSCGYKFPDRINDREITEDELIQFEKNGFSPIIRFTTKNGKSKYHIRLFHHQPVKRFGYETT